VKSVSDHFFWHVPELMIRVGEDSFRELKLIIMVGEDYTRELKLIIMVGEDTNHG
jgi:hypothetical protein